MSLKLVTYDDDSDFIPTEENSEEVSLDDLIHLVKQNGGTTSVGLQTNFIATPRDLTDEFTQEAHVQTNPTSGQDHDAVALSSEENVDIDAFKSNSEKSRKRKRRADKTTWKREVSKRNRMLGEAYIGYESKKDPATDKPVFKTGIQRGKREMGPPCRSKYCRIRKGFTCEEFTEEQRKQIHDNFWKCDWNQKKAQVCSLVDSVPVKRKSAASLGRRNETFIYYLKLNDRKVQVCRQMFLSTLSLGKKHVLNWVKSYMIETVTSPKSSSTTFSRRRESTNAAVEFVNSLPKVPSHYCRASSTKLYLEPCINSKNQLYDLYKQHSLEKGTPAASRTQFSRILEEINVGIFLPRKDQCDLCEGFKAGNIPEDQYNEHIKRKDAAQEAKRFDKQSAFEGKVQVLTMDLQAVKVCPLLKASALYYKTKLMVHNFTVYDLKSKHVLCYLWHEAEGDLCASTFATCIVDFLENHLPNDNLPVIIFSDGCTYQNRNAILGNALLEISIKQNREIIQKFLEKGHTYMECDSVHSAIESEMKNKSIYVPADYEKIIANARSKQPYTVKALTHDFFRDYSMKKYQRYHSIRPGEKKGDPCVTDIRNIRYTPSSKIYFRLSYNTEEWEELKIKPRNVLPDYPRLFDNQLKIPARKYMDLQALKKVLPSEYHSFYDNLPRNI